MSDTLTLPGFVNAHSHTFQRALRGRAGGGDFWAWRELMLAEAERQTPATVRELYASTYAEMRDAGYTAVGEFHYLGVEEARRPLDRCSRGRNRARAPPRRLRARRAAADAPGIHGRVPRSARIATGRRHPRRPRPPLRPRVPARLARGDRPLRRVEGLPLHIHACEQPREIEECLAEHGCRPIELLARAGCLGPHVTVVHATHADGAELDLLAESGTTVCACPTTEADLADGFLPAARIEHRGSRSRSARTRTSASTRSRSCGSWRGSPAVRPASAASSRPSGCSASAPTRGRARSGSSRGRRSRSISGTSRCAASSPATSSTRSCRAARRTSSAAHEAVHPERGAIQIGRLGRAAVEPPGALVRLVAAPVAAGGLDLGPLVPLVVARDRDEVGVGAQGTAPHPVVAGSVASRLDAQRRRSRGGRRSPGRPTVRTGGAADAPGGRGAGRGTPSKSRTS